MKKITIISFLLLISISLVSCVNSDKKEITSFFKQIEEKDIMNYIEADEGRYSVFLSNDSPWLYYTFSNNERHIIIARAERSFAYFMDDDNYSKIRDRKEIYYFERSKNTLYYSDGNTPITVDDFAVDDLNKIVERVHIDLGHNGDLSSFDSFHTVIKQFYKDVGAKDLELLGSDNFKVSINVSTNNFLNENTTFLNHLSTIYDNSTRNKIIDSIRNNVFNGVNIQLYYNSTNNKIDPIIRIQKNQLEFYVIDPLSENFNI
ncbi:MAG: hypothetical protein WC188_10375 [Candidatus Caldatribacteriota bacterium]|nr:hypothetical protein [Acholeplasmataceae bacterium]MDD4468601.1 hypothetical protein [Acholeplasmataceae bacterium]